MSEKKAVGRNVTVGLGMICIILAVGLVGAIVDYTSLIRGKDDGIAAKDSQISSLNSQLTEKDNVISSLNSQITDRNSQITSKDSQISSLNSQVTDLQNQVTNLTDIVNLDKQVHWVNYTLVSQQANDYTSWIVSAPYCGYVGVFVAEANTTNTYVEVVYFSHGVDYDNRISTGAGSITTYFPILPAMYIEIRVGNTNLSGGTWEAVMITYYY